MNSTLEFLKREAILCLLIIFLVTPGKGFAYQNTGKKTVTFNYSSTLRQLKQHPVQRPLPADPDSLSAYEKYQDDLASLVDYFEGKGFAIDKLLQDPRFEVYEGIGDRFRNSAEKKSPGLETYKKILGFEGKSSKIVDFIETHTDQLKKAEETYGISRYVIAAILGIESDFGRVTGKYNPFNSYVSMYAVDYRSDFARAQLEELLIWVNKNEIDVFELKSSYAGAMSSAQFIPYSLNKWFVGNDIFDMNNCILSVGNYLAYFMERTGNIETAVLRYNPSDLYARAVLDLAQEAEGFISEAGDAR